jgi:hypothetical protein
VKRGLVEPPSAPHAARVEALRARMREAGADAALVYGDVSRADDIAWLTNLCIYWNEGVIGVPAKGEPALLSKLSKRVHTWMRATSTLTDLRSGRDLAALIAEWAGDARRIALVDRDLWPAQLVRELADACGAELLDLPGAVREDRLAADPGTARELGARLAVALDEASTAEPAEAVAIVERRLRGAGALDVVATHDGVVFDVAVQQHGMWLRAARGGDVAEAGPVSHADLAPGAPRRAPAGVEGEVVVRGADSYLGDVALTRSEGHARVG